MKEHVTIRTLAEKLNVSIATVSKALKDSHEISLATKQKVWALAKELKFEPNPSASNLRSNKAKTIAVILPEVANSFFSQSIKGIEEIARQRSYHVLIYQTHEDSETEMAFINGLLNGRVDGILISVSNNIQNIEYFTGLTKKIPVVFFDRFFGEFDAVKITTNDYESAYNATQHLIDCNSKKILYLSGLDHLLTGISRKSGYHDALINNNIAYDETLIVKYEEDEQQNYKNIEYSISTKNPDGIIASIEDLVLPCYYICKDLKLNIPFDIKIISFSNLNTAPLLNPPLSTITQPACEMGKFAAIILFKMIDKKYFEPHKTIVLESTLIKRDSTFCL
ncbi:MAG: LacI family DNA-binding transcriptional regulator [Janthinobacterium lividum]